MGLWTKEQLRAFIKENKLVTAQDAQNALKELFAETLQEMLEAELDTRLGYEKHEIKAKMTPNSRNGKSKNGRQRIRRAGNCSSTGSDGGVRAGCCAEAPEECNRH